MHAVSGGAGGLPLLLVHGVDRQFQNARYWSPHYDWLATLGHFLGVDMLGHGSSQPGAADTLPTPISLGEQAAALGALLTQVDEVPAPCVIFGRSYGGRVALELARLHADLIQAFILIAPSVTSGFIDALPASVTTKPVLFVWAADDPIVPIERSEAIKGAFRASQFLNIGEVRPSASERWRAHTPEMEQPERFRTTVTEFLRGLGLVNR